MISRIKGTLLSNDLDRIEVETVSGVVYELDVPLTILPRLPQVGGAVELRTAYIVREDSASLYGFIDAAERELFQRLLGASGVGPRLALAMMSTLSARRLARALAEKDVAVLTQVPGIGKKTAEKISLELADRVGHLAAGSDGESTRAPGVEEAYQALVALGYSGVDADEAVRRAVEALSSTKKGSATDAQELIRQALSTRRG